MEEHVNTWGGKPLTPTTFGECLERHFRYRGPKGRPRTAHGIAAYIRAGAVHGPKLQKYAITAFQYLGAGKDGFSMAARDALQNPIAVKLTPNVVKRPRHPNIVPVLYSKKVKDGQPFGIEVTPLTDTTNIKRGDVYDVALSLANTGLWVEDMNSENIGRYNGRLAVFDVGSGIFDYRKTPNKFRYSIASFLALHWKHRTDPCLQQLAKIAGGAKKPKARPRKPPRIRLPKPKKLTKDLAI